jgi:ribosomal protein L32E
MIKYEEGNRVYYFLTHEFYERAVTSDSELEKLQFAEMAINRADNVFMKNRYNLEDIADMWAESQSKD